MSNYLKNYGIKKDDDCFKVAFQIPDNCEYAISITPDDVNIIAVTLKPSQKDPSTDFVEYIETFGCINDVLTVDFELPDGGDYSSGNDNGDGDGNVGDPVTKKPRLRIDDLKMQ
jgi:hypothetical protein